MIQRPTFLVRVLAVTALLVPTASAGQEPASTALIGLRVRVLVVDSTVIWGRLEDQTEDAFMLLQSDETEPTRIARDEILRMWTDDGDRFWLGAAIGGGVGTVIGLLEARGGPPVGTDNFALPILWGFGGAGVGAIIGAFVTKWVSVPF